MTTDFRALCIELADAYLRTLEHINNSTWLGYEPSDDLLLQRTRAALADEPAVPEGREPASVTAKPSDEDSTVMEIIELSSEIEAAGLGQVDFARAVLARWGRPAPAPPADVSQLSDGYHTFAELYEHRHSLMLALMRALPRICWFSRRHADGELPFGSDDWFIVGAELPGAPITYHLPAALYSLAQKTGALELPAGRPWDGHSAADVVHRLRDWAIEPAPPADGEVAECTAELEEQKPRPDYDRVQKIATEAQIRSAAQYLAKKQHCDGDLIPAIRYAIARWGSPTPQPPADGEVAELVAWLREQLHVCLQAPWTPGIKHFGRAAELLERLSPPQPVPVSERLPGPSVKVLAHYFNGLGKGRTICAIWVPAKTRSDSYGDDDFTEYDEESDTFYWPEGWYETIENWDDLGYVKVDEGEVIYWQPIPKWPAHALPLPEVGE